MPRHKEVILQSIDTALKALDVIQSDGDEAGIAVIETRKALVRAKEWTNEI